MSLFSYLLKRLIPSRATRLDGNARGLLLQDVAVRSSVLEICPVEALASFSVPAFYGAEDPFIGWESSEVTVSRFTLRDVVLDQRLMTLLHQGQPVSETVYVQDPAAVKALTIRPQDLIDVSHSGATTASCVDHWASNYYHWVAHTIPTLSVLSGEDLRLILPEHMHSWQFETLDLLGISREGHLRLQAGKQYAFDTLEYVTFLNGSVDFAVSGISRQAYARLCLTAGAPLLPSGRRLYIERANAANRHVPNEPDLASALEGRGFERIRPEELTLSEQIRLFADAGIVVGMLGAGLANIAWCHPATTVCELVPSHHINPCFAAMAMQGALRYHAFRFDTGAANENHTDQATLPLPVHEILNRIDALLLALPPAI